VTAAFFCNAAIFNLIGKTTGLATIKRLRLATWLAAICLLLATWLAAICLLLATW
jgi:hypothetical protein